MEAEKKKIPKASFSSKFKMAAKKFQAKSNVCVTWVCNVSNGIKVA